MYTVIIVDDNPWVHEDIRQTFRFEAYDFQVIGDYYDAEEAMEAIFKQPPDLIISDVRMEKLSGLDLVHMLREKELDTLVVIVSGYSRFDYAQDALRNGVFDYLLKPLDDQQAKSLMQRVVQRLGEKKAPTYSQDALGQAMRYIDEHYAVSIPLQTVADMLYLNKNYLSELFSKQLGMTFTQYKNKVRISHAKQLLKTSGLSVTEIAYATGFNSPSRFSKVFCQMEGISPQQYRAGSETDQTEG